MDVYGTRLARTLFTIATGVERGAAKQRYAADAQSASLSCKACRWRRFVLAADAHRSMLAWCSSEKTI